MEDLLIYLLKSAALASIFILAYLLLLKNATSFKLNRGFLLSGIFTSLILPSVEFTRKIIVEKAAMPENISFYDSSLIVENSVEQNINWWEIAGVIYLTGVGFFLLRFLMQFFSLYFFVRQLEKKRNGKFIFFTSTENINPFSFFNFIIFNPGLHSEEELKNILQHEKAHANQYHSVDVLLVNLFSIILWFNPLNWIYKKHLIHNLEFLADHEAATISDSKKTYQRTLLKVSTGKLQPGLSNQFYQSFIKKRIIMLNKQTNGKSSYWKTGFIFPFLFLFIFFFNIKTEAQVVEATELSGVTYESDVKVSATITPNSRKESLKRFEKLFEKLGIKLNFDDLEYSEEGVITNIKVRFENEESGETGNISLNDPEGIDPFTIFTNDEGTGFKTGVRVSENADVSSVFSELGQEPLFIIDGKQYENKELAGKVLWIKGKFNVVDPEEAVEKFGATANDGAVIIDKAEIIEDYTAHLRKIDDHNEKVNRNYIWINEGKTPYFATLVKTKTISNPDTSSIKKNIKFIVSSENINTIQVDPNTITSYINTQEKPLFIVNGEVKKADFHPNSVYKNKIKSINVLKGEAAVKKYGEKGENGVIIIDLKSEKELKEDREKALEKRKEVLSQRKKVLKERKKALKERQKTLEERKKLLKDKNEKEKDEKEPISFTVGKIYFEDGKEDGTSIKFSDIEEVDFQGSEALFVVNGEVQENDFKVGEINKENIAAITVLKGEKAIKGYGEKASEGVIEITTEK